MSNLLRCPNGHVWEFSVDNTVTDESPVVSCPMCGQKCALSSAMSGTVVSNNDPYSLAERVVVVQGLSLPTVPGYEVIGLLGQGGMGTVYKAKHVRLDRVVALKMISSEQASPSQRVRFQVEGQALAKLDHPNIVQIYEVDECNGSPYFSLEYLEGGGLDRKLAGMPQTPLFAAQMLETLARAIHWAHVHGIIHRDLKPANILLSRDGLPKISDFGLAKRLEDESSQTRTGDLLGTPAYMAPEQAIGDSKAIGPLTDQYALGVILYEMLTGRPPFRGVNTLETLQLIRFSEPVPPKRLQPGVPRDLETICLKCMEKVPAKRYASAEELADDLARFLSHQTIRARRAGLSERLGKWIWRHPAPAALIGVVVGAVLAFGVLIVWSNTQLREAAQTADMRFKEAKSVVDDLYIRFAEEWLSEEPHQDPVRQEFLEKASRLYKKFAAESGDDPEVRRGAARAHFRLGQINQILNLHSDARSAYHQAIALQDDLRRRFPEDAANRQDLANSHNWLGELYRQTGNLTDAEGSYSQAIVLQEALVEKDSQTPIYRKELARSYYNLAIILMDTDQPRVAEEKLARAFPLLADLHKKSPEVAEYRHEWARCFINRGVLHKGNRAFAQAEDDYRQAIALLRPLDPASTVKGKEEIRGPFRAVFRTDLAVTHRNLGNLLWSQDQHDKALDEMRQAMKILEKLAVDYPNRPAYQKKLADTYNSLGSVFASVKNYKDAEAHYSEARARFDRLVREHADVAEYQQLYAITLGNLGWLRSEHEDWAKARGHYEQAIQHLQSALKANQKNLVAARALGDQYQSLAETAIRLGDHAAAADAARSLAEGHRERAQDCYYAACFLARCVPLVEKDARIVDAAVRRTIAQQYVETAVSMLKKSIESGSVVRLPNEDETFLPLRNEAGFKQWLTAIDRKTKS